jgi:hypothetical protein
LHGAIHDLRRLAVVVDTELANALWCFHCCFSYVSSDAMNLPHANRYASEIAKYFWGAK